MADFSLEAHGISVAEIHRKGTAISSTGALIAYSGEKTGRSPKDKRIVDDASSRDHVWWGDVNIKLDEQIFMVNRERAIDYLNTKSHLYVVDGFAGWDERYRFKVRIICSRAYHALFMWNMLIRPSSEELANFGEPRLRRSSTPAPSRRTATRAA
jgi:phosphoenolpyruvate carboxykinase (ATP)